MLTYLVLKQEDNYLIWEINQMGSFNGQWEPRSMFLVGEWHKQGSGGKTEHNTANGQKQSASLK